MHEEPEETLSEKYRKIRTECETERDREGQKLRQEQTDLQSKGIH